MEQAGESLRDTALRLLILVPALGFFLLLLWVNPPFHDEGFIIGPSLASFGLAEYDGFHQYPAFISFFYGFFLKLASLFLPVEGMSAYRVCRLVNIVLYLANAALFYRILLPRLGRRAAFFAMVFLAYSPVGIFSGMVVKTETLNIFIVLFCIRECLKIAGGGVGLLQHLLAGFFAGLLVAVKYNPCLLPVYLASLVLARLNGAGKEEGAFRLLARSLREPGLLYFSLAFVLVAAFSFSIGHGVTARDLAFFQSSDYFAPYPTMMRSAPGFSLFHSRFGYPLLIILPFSLGLVSYLGGWLGLASRAAPRDAAVLFGVFTLFYFLATVSVTLAVMPWNYALMAPFFALCAAAFIKKLGEGAGRRGRARAGRALAGICLALVFYQALSFPIIGYGFVKNIVSVLRIAGSQDKGVMLTSTESTLRREGIPPARIREVVLNRRPEYLFVLDSYLYNFCLYPEDPAYRTQCGFMDELLSGETGYRMVWTNSIWYPFKALFGLDPGLSYTYYLFQRE